jgi:hypothetical protein
MVAPFRGSKECYFESNHPRFHAVRGAARQVPVNPITQEIEDKVLFFQSQPTPADMSRQLEASTTRIQRATDRFLDAVEHTRKSNSCDAVEVLFDDQGQPVSNEKKDAIDEGFITLHRCYIYCM